MNDGPDNPLDDDSRTLPERWQDLLQQARSGNASSLPTSERPTMVGLEVGPLQFRFSGQVEDLRGLVGQTIGPFELCDYLDRGGMCVVFKALNRETGKLVALKILQPLLALDTSMLKRFESEFEVMAKLEHPNIVRVFDRAVHDGLHMIEMELVDSPSFSKRLEAEAAKSTVLGDPHRLKWIAGLVAQVASALAYAHSRGVIHRDVKPRNILIDAEGNVRLTDFGIAVAEGRETAHTRGQIGTIDYMSPEQISVGTSTLDLHTDIFSLGTVLYESLARRHPFRGATAEETSRNITHRMPDRLDRTFGLPSDLDVICQKALEKLSSDRYPGAQHLEGDLLAWAREDRILARRPSLVRRTSRWAATYRKSALAAATLPLVLVISLMTWWMYTDWASRMAWVSVVGASEAAILSARPVDLSTLLVQPAVQSGAANKTLALEPGYFRLVVTNPDGSFFERDEMLGAGEAVISLEGTKLPTTDGMVLIPGGEYQIGDMEISRGRTAGRRVTLEPFWIDRHKVSNREYREFIEATKRPQPRIWSEFGYDESLADRPVVGIGWTDAKAYAAWKGKRLPTWNEWEAAARTADARPFPWGHDRSAGVTFEPDCETILRSNSVNITVLYASYVAATLDVSHDAPGTRCGEILQMFGLVREYTSSIDGATGAAIVKGRSWADSISQASLVSTWSQPDGGGSLKVSFRCVRSAAVPTH